MFTSSGRIVFFIFSFLFGCNIASGENYYSHRIGLDDLIHQSFKDIFPELSECCPIKPLPPIYGGTPTEVDEFPQVVLLHYIDKNGNSTFPCSGTLISRSFVLTAAHCVTGEIQRKSGFLAYIRLGEHDLSQVECNRGICSEIKTKVDRAIGKVIVHENYSSRTYQNDIALVQLSDPLYDFSSNIAPMCLRWVHKPSATILRPDHEYTVVGWGRTLNQKQSPVSNKLNVKLYDHNECVRQYGRKNVTITKGQICGGGVFKQDACDGDSGGPLISFIDGCPVLDGVISFGRGCGLENWPGVYTNVMAYRRWIVKHLVA
ncbi:unnamed protein product [Hermetia illucens]|uniref:Peptidase S1 domain-containing protein n=1 Tax=Hermetia illucens TaxID=343691 RepID=A0A7R8UBX5_HERIL|nr:serine protease 7-like [Hermetia illucens]CAD7077945.1 unnamed protein product [Hermetia illucens]